MDYTKLGPFKIKRKLRPVTFKLAISKEIRIHLIFHISLLELTTTNTTLKLINLDQETQEPLYKVKEILDHQIKDNKSHYLIYWKGYQHSEDTWEPEKYLTPAILKAYHRQNQISYPN